MHSSSRRRLVIQVTQVCLRHSKRILLPKRGFAIQDGVDEG